METILLCHLLFFSPHSLTVKLNMEAIHYSTAMYVVITNYYTVDGKAQENQHGLCHVLHLDIWTACQRGVEN